RSARRRATPSETVRLWRTKLGIEFLRPGVCRDIGADRSALLPDALSAEAARLLGRDFSQIRREPDVARPGFFLERSANVVAEPYTMRSPDMQVPDDAAAHGTFVLVRRLTGSFLRPYLGLIALSLGAMLVVAASTAANAWLMQPVLDRIFIAREEGLLWGVAL